MADAATAASTEQNGWTTLETSSGLILRVRPERPGDSTALFDLFKHLSPSSRFMRFSKVMDEPDLARVQQEAERLARLGPPLDSAWLAFVDLPEQADAPVAAVRYVRSAPDEAELAISVRDDLQRRGIGSSLVRFACNQAQQDGIRRLTVTFRSDNQGVWALLKHSPFPVSWQLDGPEVHAAIDLTGQGSG